MLHKNYFANLPNFHLTQTRKKMRKLIFVGLLAVVICGNGVLGLFEYHLEKGKSTN
jgi:hypothetical protein